MGLAAGAGRGEETGRGGGNYDIGGGRRRSRDTDSPGSSLRGLPQGRSDLAITRTPLAILSTGFSAHVPSTSSAGAF